ncbi:TolC family protein [Hymenobacter siberiensis]|uniref:TolC family protein n=1 Tax=Hymenobacter siberiensis TaxID=2848396 RepID=UPI001C1E2B8E|nr:TolC family protein [Hymenobacter siberiensis]
MRRLWLLVVFFGTSPGWGQAQPAGPLRLSLPRALALAQVSRGSYQNLQLEEQVAAQAARAVRGLYAPKLGAATDLRYNIILPTSIIPNFANPTSGERVPVSFGTVYQASAGLTFNQPLYDANALAQRPVAALTQQLAANASWQGRVALVVAVSQAYYEALLRETQLAFARADAVRAQAAYRDLAARQQVGRALANEVDQAHLAQRNASLAQAVAQQYIGLSKQHLLATLGLPPNYVANLQLTDSLPQLLRRYADTTAWQETPPALQRRPEFRQEQLNADLAAANLSAERRGYRPTVGLTGYLGANGFNDNFLQTLHLGRWFGNAYAAVQASVPLLDGSARATRLETQRLRQQQARNRQADLQQTIGYEVANARTQLQLAWQTVQVKEENIAVTARSAELTALRQQAGRALGREVLAAEATRQQAQREYLQAVYDFLIARLEYQRVTGTLTD